MDNRWKKTVIRSTRFCPVLMDMVRETECKSRRIDFSNYIRLAATAAMKHNKESGSCRDLKGQHAITYKLHKGMKMTNHIISKRRLKPFNQFLPECFRRHTIKGSLGQKLTEETLDWAITGASGIVIDSALTEDERVKAINDFAKEIANMNGERIVAIAIVTN